MKCFCGHRPDKSYIYSLYILHCVIFVSAVLRTNLELATLSRKSVPLWWRHFLESQATIFAEQTSVRGVVLYCAGEGDWRMRFASALIHAGFTLAAARLGWARCCQVAVHSCRSTPASSTCEAGAPPFTGRQVLRLSPPLSLILRLAEVTNVCSIPDTEVTRNVHLLGNTLHLSCTTLFETDTCLHACHLLLFTSIQKLKSGYNT